jgi:hypothetical protein
VPGNAAGECEEHGKHKLRGTDVKAIDGVNVCCLTTAKCQNETSVTTTGEAPLHANK